MKNFLLILLSGLFLANFAQASYAKISYRLTGLAERFNPYANFNVNEYREEVKGGAFVISYTLPLELVGEKRRVEFKASQGQGVLVNAIELTGVDGKLICGIEGFTGMRVCEAEYRKDFVSNPEKAANYIRSLNISEQEKAIRLEVAALFARMPIGFLTFYPSK